MSLVPVIAIIYELKRNKSKRISIEFPNEPNEHTCALNYVNEVNKIR